VILSRVLTAGLWGALLEGCGVALDSGGVGAVSLRPRSFQRIPVRTVRTAWAARRRCWCGTGWMCSSRTGSSRTCIPAIAVGGSRRGSWRWCRCCSSRRTCPTGPRRTRTRIDWKYALGLELDDPGFDYSVLCEFRARLAEGGAADRLLEPFQPLPSGRRRWRPGSGPRVPPSAWPSRVATGLVRLAFKRRQGNSWRWAFRSHILRARNARAPSDCCLACRRVVPGRLYSKQCPADHQGHYDLLNGND
jgi:hypothetical protein